MAIIGMDGRYQRVNPALCQLLGYTESELKGLRFLDITHPSYRKAGEADTRRLRDGETDSLEMEKRYIAKDGRIVHALTRVGAVRDASGRPEQMLTPTIDPSSPHAGQDDLLTTHQH